MSCVALHRMSFQAHPMFVLLCVPAYTAITRAPPLLSDPLSSTGEPRNTPPPTKSPTSLDGQGLGGSRPIKWEGSPCVLLKNVQLNPTLLFGLELPVELSRILLRNFWPFVRSKNCPQHTGEQLLD